MASYMELESEQLVADPIPFARRFGLCNGFFLASLCLNFTFMLLEDFEGFFVWYVGLLKFDCSLYLVMGDYCSYQLEGLEKALKQNTIVFLETGSGKTLIAIMLLRSFAHQLRKPSPFFAVFLVPQVVLVTQVCTNSLSL